MKRSSVEGLAIFCFRVRRDNWTLATSDKAGDFRLLCPDNAYDIRLSQATQWQTFVIEDQKICVPEYAYKDDPYPSEEYLFIGGEYEGQIRRVMSNKKQFKHVNNQSQEYVRQHVDGVPIFALKGIDETMKFRYYCISDLGGPAWNL